MLLQLSRQLGSFLFPLKTLFESDTMLFSADAMYKMLFYI